MKNLRFKYSSLGLFSAAVLVLAGSLSFSSAMAAGACKELKKDACMSSSSCSWINSYTTKKGNTIKAYCRNKPKQKSSQKLSSDKKG